MASRNSSGNSSFTIAFWVLGIELVAIVVLMQLDMLTNFIWPFIMAVFIAMVTFFVSRRVFMTYMEKKILPIYKTIQTVADSQKELRKKINTRDISLSIKEEVDAWAINKEEEIKQLREMEQYRKDFLGNVSHELKTPIFNIQGYILTLLDGGLEDEKINTLYLQRAEKSINRMISIVDDLVSISRLEAGEFKLNSTEFNIVKLIEDIFEGQEMLAKKYKIKLEFDNSYNKPIRVYADKKRITEVLNNLIINSLKYGTSNGKTTVGFVDTGDTILVDITDSGIGISEEDLPRIFERFYRVDKSRSRDSGGTGLGLAIVKHIIQAHNQTINVRSAVGRGTSFVFSLEKAKG